MIRGLTSICLTNHGDIDDASRLEQLSPTGLSIITGVEISSTVGDFIIFSDDRAFLRSLMPEQQLPERAARPKNTAVVWAHPFAGNPGGLNANADYIKDMASRVDGIEVYNGRWPDTLAASLAQEIAGEYSLAELGGSDAHQVGQLMLCWTAIAGEITSTAELVEAIRGGNTTACRIHESA